MGNTKINHCFFYLYDMKKYNRKWIFYLSVFFIFCLYLPAFSQKPNILWITIEDTSPEFIGCYGNKNASTPVIDQLSEEGVQFTNAFSTGTVCSPSRFTIITGVHTYEAGTGDHRSRYPIPDFIKGFPWYLREAGYYTTNNSKTDYNTSDIKRLIKGSWNESSNKAGWWGRKPGQPFFAVFNFADSHQSRTMTWPYEKYKTKVLDKLSPEEQIGENDFDMPPFYRDDPQMRKQMARVYNSLKLTDNKIGALLARLKKDHLMDSTIIFFYGDHGEGIPRGKTNGIDLGYRVPFIIWFPPAYRDLSPWGTGVVTDGLTNFEDLAPTLLSLAGIEIPDYMQGRALLGSQRTPTPRFILGSTDRSDESTDLERSVISDRYIYNRNFMAYMPEMRWMKYQEVAKIKQLMRADFQTGKLNKIQSQMFLPRPAESLYDLKNDPWELHNLVNDPNMQPLLDSMREALKENIIQSKDIMFLPEYERALISKQTTPYEYRLDKENYPIKEVYAAASLSGKRGKDILLQQIKLLKDNNKIIRYWAITGLKAQPSELLKKHKNILENTLQDNYPPVKIMGASICYELFADEEAKNILIDFCKNKNENLALLALQNISYLSKIKPFTKAIKYVSSGQGATDAYNLKAITDVLLYRLGVKELSLK